MIINIYSLFDKVEQNYKTISLNTRDEVEKRNLSWSVNNDSHFLFMAKDMELYKLAQFNTETGDIFHVKPVFICRASDLIGADKKVQNEI